MTTEPIRVLIADDHPAYRAGVRALLRMDPGIEVIAEAGSTGEAVAAAGDLQPDVVMMDVRMPGGGGVAATREIVRQSPHIAVLVLTVAEEDETIFAVFRAGACGYLVKAAGQGELSRAVHTVAMGGIVCSPQVKDRMLAHFSAAAPQAAAAGVFPMLTDREREILDLIAEGRDNTFLARRLTLSPKTVRNHISNIFAKLHVSNRAEAIVRAREAGMGRAGGVAEPR